MYFGLAGGFNARARAANFEDGELAEVMVYLHGRGVKGFVALNTLVRPHNLTHAWRICMLSKVGHEQGRLESTINCLNMRLPSFIKRIAGNV